jgi:hypothetical protein
MNTAYHLEQIRGDIEKRIAEAKDSADVCHGDLEKVWDCRRQEALSKDEVMRLDVEEKHARYCFGWHSGALNVLSALLDHIDHRVRMNGFDEQINTKRVKEEG